MNQIGIKATSKGVILILIVVILVFLGMVGGFVYYWNCISARTAEMQKKKDQVDQSQQMANTLQDTKVEYEDMKGQLQNLELSISTEAYIPTLLKQLETMSTNVNMRVVGVRPTKDEPVAVNTTTNGSGKTPKKEEKPYKEQKIDLELEGYYADAISFIYRLTEFPKIVAVNNVQMSPVSQLLTSGSPKLKVQVNLTAFIMTDMDSLKTIDDGKKIGSESTGQGGTGNETR